MQRPSTFASLLIVALVAANVVGLYYVAQVRGDIDRLQATLAQQSGLHSDIDRLRSDIAAMREDQEWISSIDLSVGDRSRDGISICATWQVKDFTEGSQVALYWQGPQDDGFREITAQRLGGGRFQAEVKEPVTLMPEIMILPTSAGDGKAGRVEEKTVEDRPMSCTYFVSVRTGESVKSTDAETMDLSKISASRTYGLSLLVEGDSKKTSVTLREVPTPFIQTPLRLESASLEGFSGSSKVLDLAFVRLSSLTDTPVFEAETPKPTPAVSDLWLNLVYAGGETVKVKLAPSTLQ